MNHWSIQGSPALTKQPCKTCKEETLHKGNACIYCGRVFQYPTKIRRPRTEYDAKRAKGRARARLA